MGCDDGETGSIIIKGTCSLDPNVRVVSIERIRLEGRDPPNLSGRTFVWNLAFEARLGACVFFAFMPRVGPAPVPPFVDFAGTEPLLANFFEMSNTRHSYFGSLINARRDRLFAVCLSCFSLLESNRLVRDLPTQKGIRQSAISPIATEAESIIPGTC